MVDCRVGKKFDITQGGYNSIEWDTTETTLQLINVDANNSDTLRSGKLWR